MSDKKPLFGVLAGEPEIIGERCADGGKCHHRCTDTCWRRTSCAPLSGSGLRYDWSAPALRAHDGLDRIASGFVILDGMAFSKDEILAHRVDLCNALDRADVAERERDQLRAEVDALRKDAERYRWASSGPHEAETLASIVHCHGGYAEKVAERVDVYREAAMAAKDPEPEHRMDAKVKAAAISLAPERSGRIYIAGPMTGLPDFNFPAFNDMAAILRGLGYHVENPAEHGVVEGAEWADYLRYDIARLATCEALVLLPGWRHSRGALLEVHIAKALGIQITFAEVFSRFDAEEGA